MKQQIMENDIDPILLRALNGQASSDDMLALNQWLNESDEHRQEFLALKAYYQADVEVELSADAAQSYDRLWEKIQNHNRRQKRRLFVRYSSVAAVVVLCVALSYVLFLKHTTTCQPTVMHYTYAAAVQKKQVKLKDGTLVVVNKNSKITIDDKYGVNDRCVKLAGEAYFEVVKDSRRPFKVDLGGAKVTVLGTHFDIHSQRGIITVTLVEGSVRFEEPTQTVVMKPNQQMTYNRMTKEITLSKVDAESSVCWKDGLLKFRSVPLSKMLKDISRDRGVDIRFADSGKRYSDVTITGTFTADQNVEEILKVVSQSLPVHWCHQRGIYYIK
jgi:transmembrane sensor